MNQAANLPTFQDEFERKLLEACHGLADKYNDGKISAEAYQHGLEALNIVARGLCPETYCLWLDHERDMVGYDNHDRETVVMAKDDGPMVVLTRERGGKEMRVMRHEGDGKTTDRRMAYDNATLPDEACQKDFNHVLRKLVHKGYGRLL